MITDRPTDRLTDRQTDRPTDMTSYRSRARDKNQIFYAGSTDAMDSRPLSASRDTIALTPDSIMEEHHVEGIVAPKSNFFMNLSKFAQ